MRSLLIAFALACMISAAPATQPAAVENGIAVYFSPNGGAAQAVIERIASARATIDIARYSFTHGCTIIELNGESYRFRESTGTSPKRAVGKERTTVRSEKPAG